MATTSDKVEPTFWMVWNPNGHAPIKRYESYGHAVKDAHALAAAQPENEFFVLKAKRKISAVVEAKTEAPA